MNRNAVFLAIAAVFSAGAARAQTPSAPVAQPSSPAPNVASTVPPSPTASAVIDPNAARAVASVPDRVTQIVYTPQLPSAAELSNAAAAQNLTVERIVQTSSQVIAFYRSASGQAISVAYQSLPPTGTTPATAAPATAAPAVVVTSPPRTVVYETEPRVIYYDYPGYYYPRAWYPPVSLGFNFGYRSFYGGHFRGGFRH